MVVKSQYNAASQTASWPWSPKTLSVWWMMAMLTTATLDCAGQIVWMPGRPVPMPGRLTSAVAGLSCTNAPAPNTDSKPHCILLMVMGHWPGSHGTDRQTYWVGTDHPTVIITTLHVDPAEPSARQNGMGWQSLLAPAVHPYYDSGSGRYPDAP